MTTRIDPTELLTHADSLRLFVRSLLRDEASSDDVVQETWVRAVGRPAPAADSPRAWLFAVARNLVRERHRATGRRLAREQLAARPEADDCDPAEVTARVEALQHVTRAVLDLDEPYRSTLLLRFFDDVPPERIASQAGVPAATVRTRVRRGLEQVRLRLDREAGDWRATLAPLVAVTDGLPPPTPPTRWGRVAVAAVLVSALCAWVLPHLLWPLVEPRHDIADAVPVVDATEATDVPAPPEVEGPEEPLEPVPEIEVVTGPPVAPVPDVPKSVPPTAPADPLPGERPAAREPTVELPPDLGDVVVAGDPHLLRSVGSDTMNNLMTYWGQELARIRPGLKVSIEGRGSSTAAPALIEICSDLGPMTRPMKPTEVEAFEQKLGRPPAKARVALDALAIFVHRDNPVRGLSLAQVDAIFSSTRRRGGADVTTWGQAGLTGEWADRPISLHGRNQASGTYGYFKESALRKGDLRNAVREHPGSAGVVLAVSEDVGAIGYSGIGYATSGVRAVPIAEAEGGGYVTAGPEQVRDRTYPLGRALLVYFDGPRARAPDDPVRAFLSLVLSAEGQSTVVKDGYLPLSEDQIAEGRESLGLDR